MTYDTPLFPTHDGQHPGKKEVVIAFVELSVLAGTISRGTKHSIGGHSARVTGARMLASLGLEISKIQLIGRWASDVILRYVADTPLDTVTRELRDLIAGSSRGADEDIDSTLHSIEDKLCSLEDKDLASSCIPSSAPSGNILRIADGDTTFVQPSFLESPTFFVNKKTGRCHSLAIMTELPDGKFVRSKCGWITSACNIRLASDIEDIGWRAICEKCSPSERVRVRENQPSDSESTE